MAIGSRAGSAVPRRGWVRTRTRIALVVAAACVVLVIVALSSRPRSLPGPPPPSLHFGTPAISGTPTSGWTFLLRAHLAPWVGPGQMPWLNVTFRLVNESSGGPETSYSIPAGTTLRVFPPSGNVSPPYGSPVAVYNLSTRTWEGGGGQAVVDGEWIVLEGIIPPGRYAGDPGSSTFSGPALLFTARFGNGTWTMGVDLGAQPAAPAVLAAVGARAGNPRAGSSRLPGSP